MSTPTERTGSSSQPSKQSRQKRFRYRRNNSSNDEKHAPTKNDMNETPERSVSIVSNDSSPVVVNDKSTKSARNRRNRKPKSQKPDAGTVEKPSKHSNKSATRHVEEVNTGSSTVQPLANGTAPSETLQRFMTTDKFSSLHMHSDLQKALAEEFGYVTMSAVQAAATPIALKGADVLAKAKTGTGKTLAFLIPLVEQLIGLQSRNQLNGICGVVLAPTRELAQQIFAEARRLLKFRSSIQVGCVVGGTNIRTDQSRLAKGVHLLIATPGRLIDHIKNTKQFTNMLKNESSASTKKGSSNIQQVLVLDEADRMLDMGFRPDIETIIGYLQPSRQTLLFSATTPDSLHDVVNVAFTREHTFIDCVGDDTDVHKHVDQSWAIVPLEEQIKAVASFLERQMKEPDQKVMVFLPTARQCGYFADLFEAAGWPNILQIHSRMSQSARTKTASKFRTTSNVILFSSDVSARGVDYPDVTCVLQIGQTTQEQYVHRLGRTARAGANGIGMLILGPFETKVATQKLSDMLPKSPISLGSLSSGPRTTAVLKTIDNIQRNHYLRSSAEKAYVAWLGFYNSSAKITGWSKPQLVKEAARFAKSMGLQQPPAIPAKTLGKMGLRKVPGIIEERGFSHNPARQTRGPSHGGSATNNGHSKPFQQGHKNSKRSRSGNSN